MKPSGAGEEFMNGLPHVRYVDAGTLRRESRVSRIVELARQMVELTDDIKWHGSFDCLRRERRWLGERLRAELQALDRA
jgi:hypothetical protein